MKVEFNLKKTVLFFGTFNPIHIGHLIIAEYVANLTDVLEVWLVVSPQSPFKKNNILLDENNRFDLVNETIKENPKLKAVDIEFFMPKPSYTIDTIEELEKKYPDKEFAILMGGDNLLGIAKWKNYLDLLRKCEVFVYPRPNYEIIVPDFKEVAPKFHILENAPTMEISASYIRDCIKKNYSVKYLLHSNTMSLIEKWGFYK